ncbi:hypothetical protein EYF80_035219 [Liparis tanakae]|uniref:Uncharacterized protein n=1 Tax=Liparis tanakae TaxID=230148 RepID=A0A4Z2GMP8_9TELE|nr:hypothetical protein EYF80_035219 [Liparis tanakae]
MYMSVFPSPTFSPSKDVMSSGGVAEPTFQVMTCSLLETGVYKLSSPTDPDCLGSKADVETCRDTNVSRDTQEGTCLKSSTVWAWLSAVPATERALCV